MVAQVPPEQGGPGWWRSLPRRRRKFPTRRPEQDFQRAAVQYLDAVLEPPAFFFAIPNGGARLPIEAAIMAGLGVRAGMPDLCILATGRAYFLELKSDKGNLSAAQREIISRLRQAGCEVAVVRSLDAIAECLREWTIPTRGRLVA